jgi:hypothetical protein
LTARVGATKIDRVLSYRLLYRVGFTPWDDAPGPKLLDRVLDGESAGAGRRALDVGCGKGRDAIHLAKKGWEVTAVDLEERAIGKARERAAEAGAHVHWIVGDVTKLGTLATPPGYSLIYDLGCIQGLPDEAAARAAGGITSLATEDATLLLVAFARGRRMIHCRPQGAAANPQGKAHGVSLGQGVDPKSSPASKQPPHSQKPIVSSNKRPRSVPRRDRAVPRICHGSDDSPDGRGTFPNPRPAESGRCRRSVLHTRHRVHEGADGRVEDPVDRHERSVRRNPRLEPPRLLGPTQLLQADRVVPDLRHVTDAIAVEIHDVDVIRLDLVPGRRDRSALAGVRSPEDAVRGDVPFVPAAGSYFGLPLERLISLEVPIAVTQARLCA